MFVWACHGKNGSIRRFPCQVDNHRVKPSKRWNALPRVPAPKWSDSFPTQDGLYWTRRGEDESVEVVEIEGESVWTMGNITEGQASDFIGYKFFGPIQPTSEAPKD